MELAGSRIGQSSSVRLYSQPGCTAYRVVLAYERRKINDLRRQQMYLRLDMVLAY